MNSIKRVGLYVRCSTHDKQSPEMQLRDLREYCRVRRFEIVQEFQDQTSGAKERRPGLDGLMDAVRKRRIDMLERNLIRERIHGGLRNARAKGKKLGRPFQIDRKRVEELRSQGMSLNQIAKTLNCTKSGVSKSLRQASASKAA